MKLSLLSLLAGGCALGCVGLSAAPIQAQVEFVHPERFSDAKLRSVPNDKSEDELAVELTRTIRESAAKRLPGRQLEVRVLDVRLAGRRTFEQPAGKDDVRVLDDTHPPHIVVDYRVRATDSGRVLASGHEDLTDLNYKLTVFVDYTDRLFYERVLLRDWINRLAGETDREASHRR